MTHDTSDREIVITRVINAPRERVWEAWSDPEQLAQWWGPDGFTLTTESFDMRIGGEWRFVMHGPDGTDYPNFIRYAEIRKPEFMKHIHGGGDDPDFEAMITFEDQREQTLITMRTVFALPEVRDHVVKEYNAIEGGTQTLNRLHDFLTS